MKVICIDNTNRYLTLNKIYTVETVHDGFYRIMNDDMVNDVFRTSRFITLQDHRNNLIKEILEL